MPLRAEDVAKLSTFLDKLAKDVYPEPISSGHSSISAQMWEICRQNCSFKPGDRVLDVGCGQGVGLELFQAAGLKTVGITLSSVDAQVCRDRGFEVYEMDQSFLDFPDATFDFIWCRHCLEHSLFPYFTLHELRRVLKPERFLFVEVPAPDTSCRHQTNRNHYSVLGKSMWIDLMHRAGFRMIQALDIQFTVPAGPDVYWAFILQGSTSGPTYA